MFIVLEKISILKTKKKNSRVISKIIILAFSIAFKVNKI